MDHIESAVKAAARLDRPALRIVEKPSFHACSGGPCRQGRLPCPCPESCALPEDGIKARALRLVDRFIAWITPGRFAAIYGASIALALLAVHLARR